MEVESECPCRRFSGLARGTAGQRNGCISSSEGAGRCFCVGHRIYSPKRKKKKVGWRSPSLAFSDETWRKSDIKVDFSLTRFLGGMFRVSYYVHVLGCFCVAISVFDKFGDGRGERGKRRGRLPPCGCSSRLNLRYEVLGIWP